MTAGGVDSEEFPRDFSYQRFLNSGACMNMPGEMGVALGVWIRIHSLTARTF